MLSRLRAFFAPPIFPQDEDKTRQAAEDKSRQMEQMRALFSIEQAVLSSMDLHQILYLLVREVVKQLHVDAASVLLVNPKTQRLEFAAGEGFRTQALRFTRLEIGSGLAGQAAQQLKTLYIEDLTTLDNPVLTKSIAGEEFVTYYGVPLFGKDQLQGVLEIFHRSPLAPDPEWLAILDTLAAQAAISIHNASLLEDMQQSLKETNALYRISQSLASSLDPDQLMQDVVDLLYRDFGFYNVQILPFGLRQQYAWWPGMEAANGADSPEGRTSACRWALALSAMWRRSASHSRPTLLTGSSSMFSDPLLPDTQAEMAIPIKIEGQVLGVLDIQQTSSSALTDRQMQLMEAVADQLAVALQKASLYAKLQNSLQQEKAMRSQMIQNERLVVVGRLLASVSHELNNPIQAIQNALFLIKEEETFSKQGRQDLEIIISETERMAALIDRLRTAYRPTRSEDYQDVQVNDLVEFVRALTATHMRHNNIRFDFQPAPDPPIISGIPEQLRQVFLNLFMNAIEAMREGGQLTVRSEHLPSQGKILLTFTDTGTGIDPQFLPHIFEPFITSKDMGTGLGLTITYDILQQHRGEIQAENNPQGGTTFKNLAAGELKGMGMVLNGHILIIDDEAALRQTLTRILQRAGLQVTSAASGQEGLDYLEQHSFDLVYLDIRMPDMNGMEVLKIIHAGHPELPVVLFTAQPDLSSALEALRRGATDYLLKPLQPDDIVERTRAILARQLTERRKLQIQAQIDALQDELRSLTAEAEQMPERHPLRLAPPTVI